jgi:hypothetical protein
MFSGNSYRQKNLPHSDIFDGIIVFIYLIMIINIGVCLGQNNPTNSNSTNLNSSYISFNLTNYTSSNSTISYITDEIFGLFITISVVEGILCIAKILFCILYTGSNKDYQDIKTYVIGVPIIIGLPIFCFSLFILIKQMNKDIYALSCTLAYVLLSFMRCGNYYIYLTSKNY